VRVARMQVRRARRTRASSRNQAAPGRAQDSHPRPNGHTRGGHDGRRSNGTPKLPCSSRRTRRRHRGDHRITSRHTASARRTRALTRGRATRTDRTTNRSAIADPTTRPAPSIAPTLKHPRQDAGGASGPLTPCVRPHGRGRRSTTKRPPAALKIVVAVRTSLCEAARTAAVALSAPTVKGPAAGRGVAATWECLRILLRCR
jgi:hypothetical protein